MIDGTLIFQGTTVYSPWFPRGGDFVVVTAELVAKSGSTPSLKIELYHKDSSDTGDGDNVDSAGTPKNITLTTVGRTSTDWAASGTISGFKELVRYKFTMSGSGGNDWSLYRLLPPQWYDTVDAS